MSALKRTAAVLIAGTGCPPGPTTGVWRTSSNSSLQPIVTRISGWLCAVRISDAAKSEQGLIFFQQPIDQALPLLAGRRFDLILLISTLEHLWEPQPVLTACHGLLNAGGTLLVNVPTWTGKRWI